MSVDQWQELDSSGSCCKHLTFQETEVFQFLKMWKKQLSLCGKDCLESFKARHMVWHCIQHCIVTMLGAMYCVSTPEIIVCNNNKSKMQGVATLLQGIKGEHGWCSGESTHLPPHVA